MKLEKLPAVHQNLAVAFTECQFVHLRNGREIGTGSIVRALNSECLEAAYLRAGERRSGGSCSVFPACTTTGRATPAIASAQRCTTTRRSLKDLPGGGLCNGYSLVARARESVS